jgi:hypothetical protein
VALTYMSIRDRIGAVLDKDLFCLPPLDGGESIRFMFVSHEVLESVQPPFPEHWYGYRLGQFRGTLDAFTENQWLSIAGDPYNKASWADLAPVAPVELRIWDIRSMSSRPQIRCFGGWAERDTFIALTWAYRDDIEDFVEEAEKCREIWDRILGPCLPFKGKNQHEYLSEHYELV